MKKLVILLFVLILLVSPLFIGNKIESRLNEFAISLDETPGYIVKLESYEKGYLNSTGYLRVTVDPDLFTSGISPEQREQMQSFLDFYEEGVLLKINFSHGPYLTGEQKQNFGLLSAGITFAETPDFIQTFKEQNGIDKLLITEMVMGFSGNGEVSINSPSFDFNNNDIVVSYGGFESFSTLSNWGAEYDAEGAFHETTINSPQNNFSAQLLPITYTASGDLSKGFMFATGDAEFHFAGLNSNGPVQTKMEDLDIKVSVSAPSEETISVDYQLKMNNLTSSIMEFPLSNAVFDFSLSDLQTQTLMNYYENMSNPALTEDPLLMQQAMVKQVADMFSGGVQYRINQLGFEYGTNINLSLATGFSFDDGAGTLLTDPAIMQNPMALMAVLIADLDLQFSEGFLNFAITTFLQYQSASLLAAGVSQADIPLMLEQQRSQYLMMVPQLLESGILKTSNNKYSISAEFNKGELEVNGQPYPLPF